MEVQGTGRLDRTCHRKASIRLEKRAHRFVDPSFLRSLADV